MLGSLVTNFPALFVSDINIHLELELPSFQTAMGYWT